MPAINAHGAFTPTPENHMTPRPPPSVTRIGSIENEPRNLRWKSTWAPLPTQSRFPNPASHTIGTYCRMPCSPRKRKSAHLRTSPTEHGYIFLRQRQRRIRPRRRKRPIPVPLAPQKFGPLAPDEVYGFEPPLFAGGAATLHADHLAKLKLDQHLTILRQLGGIPQIPFANVPVDIDA